MNNLIPRFGMKEVGLKAQILRSASFAAISIAIALSGCATGLQQAASPEAAGLSSERVKELTVAFQNGVDKKEIPGAVILIARHGKIGYFEAFGYRDREAGAPMSRDAIFRIASMTKPVTIVAAMLVTMTALRIASKRQPPTAD